MQPLSYFHEFVPASAANVDPVLLLHGTGSNEHDLLPLGREVAPGAALLSPRGDVNEHGMPRFFRRLAEGVFDLADVERRALALADFLGAAAQRYGFAADRLQAVGYSNGANIAAAVLQLRPAALAGAVLLRPMVVLPGPIRANLDGKRVLIVSGRADPIVPADHPRRLADAFTAAGATVDLHWLDSGHQLTRADLRLAAGHFQPQTAT